MTQKSKNTVFYFGLLPALFFQIIGAYLYFIAFENTGWANIIYGIGGMHLNGVKKVSVSNYFQIVFNKKRIILYQSSVNLRKTVLIKAFYVRYKATSLK